MSKNKAPDPAVPVKGTSRRLDPQIHEFVARSLRSHYDSIIEATVPDRFLVLLAKLEDQERKMASKEQANGQ